MIYSTILIIRNPGNGIGHEGPPHYNFMACQNPIIGALLGSFERALLSCFKPLSEALMQRRPHYTPSNSP